MRLWPFSPSAPIETRDESVADPDGVLAALWSGVAPGAVAVTGAEALRVPAVASAVRLISEAAATLGVRVMRREANGTEAEDLAHPVGALLRSDVNAWTSGFALVRDLVSDALCRDAGGLAIVTRVRGEVREVVRLQPGAISCTLDPFDGSPEYRLNGQVIDRASVLHVRPPFDRAPLSLAAEAIGVAREMERHAGNLFKRGARPAGVLKTPKSVGDNGVKRMLAAWRAAHEGGGNSGRTAILYDGAEYQQTALTSVDAQFLELRKFQILEICRAFRVPPSMLFELDRATWSNGEQQGKEFLSYSLEPWLRALETALDRALFSREERQRFRISFDRDDLTRADLTARATAISSLISAKVLNANEARTWLDLGPYAGGDSFENPHINPNADGAPPAAEAKPEGDDA